MGHEKRRRLKYARPMGNYSAKNPSIEHAPDLNDWPHTKAGRKAKYDGALRSKLDEYLPRVLSDLVISYVPDEIESVWACVVEQMAWGRTSLRKIRATGVRDFVRRARPERAGDQDLELEAKYQSVMDDLSVDSFIRMMPAFCALEMQEMCDIHRVCDYENCQNGARWMNNLINGRDRDHTKYKWIFTGTKRADEERVAALLRIKENKAAALRRAHFGVRRL